MAIDPKYHEELIRILGSERINYCYQCGTCTARCPSAHGSPKYNPRRILLKARKSIDDVISDEALWLCSNCHTCDDVCPQDVRIGSVITALMNISVEEGHLLPGFAMGVKAIADQGRTIGTGGVDRVRSKAGLGPITELDGSDIKYILEKTGFGKIVEEAMKEPEAAEEVEPEVYQ